MIRRFFFPLWKCWRLSVCNRALRQLHPADPRVPEVVLERAEVERATS